MKNINKEIYQIICNNLKVNTNTYAYYKSGLCSDLFIDKGKEIILKIVKWHIITDNIEDVINKYKEKKEFLDYLINNKFNINSFAKRKKKYSIIEYDNNIYIGYFIDYLNIGEEHNRIEEIKLILKFHELSRNYKYIWKYSWENDFNSILNICRDRMLYNKMLYFKHEFNKISKDDYGLIHFDLNKHNIVKTGNKYYMIDFDTLTTGFYEMDIAGYLFSNFVIDFKKNLYIDINERIDYIQLIKEYYRNDIVFLERVDLFMQYKRLSLYIILKDVIEKNKRKEIEKDILENNTILPYGIDFFKNK